MVRSKTKKRYSVEILSRSLGYSRQGYYTQLTLQKKRATQEAVVLLWVKEKRKEQPMMGTTKLYKELQKENNPLYHIGRDRLYEILWHHGLLLERKRNGRRTTNSNHWYGYAPNLIYNMEINHTNQVLVSDITYIRTGMGFGYLALITDYYSRRIVGWDYSQSLSLEGALRALKRACRHIVCTENMIHHSDRGIQYASNTYRKYLKKKGIFSSMTEDQHVYENALAERVNGILKQELGLGFRFVNHSYAKKAISKAISIYNKRRPHMSLDYKYPDEIYFENQENNTKLRA